jgi:hypothetical protein
MGHVFPFHRWRGPIAVRRRILQAVCWRRIALRRGIHRSNPKIVTRRRISWIAAPSVGVGITRRRPGITTRRRTGITTRRRTGITTRRRPGITTRRRPGITTRRRPGITTRRCVVGIGIIRSTGIGSILGRRRPGVHRRLLCRISGGLHGFLGARATVDGIVKCLRSSVGALLEHFGICSHISSG